MDQSIFFIIVGVYYLLFCEIENVIPITVCAAALYICCYGVPNVAL